MSLSRILNGVLVGTAFMILAMSLTAALSGAIILALGWLLMGAIFCGGSAGLFGTMLKYAESPIR